MNESVWKELPRFILSGFIVVYFGYALVDHWTAGLEQTLTNIAMIMIGYWFGSSKGSTDKAEQLAGKPAPQSAKEGADQAAGAATDEATKIGEQTA